MSKLKFKKAARNFVPIGILQLWWKLREGKLLWVGSLRLATSRVRHPQTTHMSNISFEIVKNTSSNEELVKITHEHYKFPFFLRNNTSDVYLYQEIIEKKEYDFIVEIEPKVLIDAGANIGLATIFFANKYPDAKIIAIEPEKSNFNMLKLNTEHYVNVHLIKAALWNSICDLNLIDNNYGNWGFVVDKDKNSSNCNGIKHLTESITIEKIIEDYDIEKIDILKMDIEGAEKEVLDNCAVWINDVNSIIIELHEKLKRGCNSSFRKISNYFDKRCSSGENIYLTKDDYIKMV